MEILQEPWPWYVAGPMITLTMLLIGYFGKTFGISSSLRTVCGALGAGRKIAFFDFDWKSETWNLVFVAGAVCGGFIASKWLSLPEQVDLSSKTINDLQMLGVTIDNELIPQSLFAWDQLFTLRGFILMIVGGFFVGFGTRYAGGCTSGHAITGLSNFQMPSLIAVIGFFVGGLIMTHLILPHILKL